MEATDSSQHQPTHNAKKLRFGKLARVAPKHATRTERCKVGGQLVCSSIWTRCAANFGPAEMRERGAAISVLPCSYTYLPTIKCVCVPQTSRSKETEDLIYMYMYICTQIHAVAYGLDVMYIIWIKPSGGSLSLLLSLDRSLSLS